MIKSENIREVIFPENIITAMVHISIIETENNLNHIMTVKSSR